MIPPITVEVGAVTLGKWVWSQAKRRNVGINQLPDRIWGRTLLIDFWEQYGRGDPEPLVIMNWDGGVHDGEPHKISHDVEAYFEVLDSLESTYRIHGGNIHDYDRIVDAIDPDVDEREQRTNSITIGGPEVNKITSEALDDCPNGYDFVGIDADDGVEETREWDDLEGTNKRIITDKGSNDYFETDEPADDGWEDLALVARIRNPLDETSDSSDMIVVSGAFGPGTVAAAKFFNTPELLAEVYDGGNEYFQAVLRVHVNSLGTISSMEIADDKVIREQTYDRK